jgi:hypothetical protein
VQNYLCYSHINTRYFCVLLQASHQLNVTFIHLQVQTRTWQSILPPKLFHLSFLPSRRHTARLPHYSLHIPRIKCAALRQD